MSVIKPAMAIVRPRVTGPHCDDPRPLDDVVSEMLDGGRTGNVRIVGGPGSGKSTALAHLAAVVEGERQLVLLDEPLEAELARVPVDALLVVSTPASGRSESEFVLAPWGLDELVEFLLAIDRAACGDVIARLGDAANWSWPPQLAVLVVKQFLTHPDYTDAIDSISRFVRERLTHEKQFSAVCGFCLALSAPSGKEIEYAVARLKKLSVPADVRDLLRHESVWIPLAAESLIAMLSSRDPCRALKRKLPDQLVGLIGNRCAAIPKALDRLRKLIAPHSDSALHPMAASILHAADPGWRPEPRHRGHWNLAGAYLNAADWSNAELASAVLMNAVLVHAKLNIANLEHAQANGARFDAADLRDAKISRIVAKNASFRQAILHRVKAPNALFNSTNFAGADLSEAALMGCDLTGAQLSRAKLVRADLTASRLLGAILDEADLSGAILRHAALAAVDFRTATLDDACFERAVLDHAQLEDVTIRRANFRLAQLKSAHLTGSSLPAADLREADLSGAGLAEIDWENADLRGAALLGASFHMGSSRSGLVGSPIACEGSKTGFYTDDYEDMHFKRPEEVRKANLRGADLRGARIDKTDFYMVDLRDAKLDPDQLEHVRKCGAILEDVSI